MVNELRAIVLPTKQRRTLEELTEDLDLLVAAALPGVAIAISLVPPLAEVTGLDFESGTLRIDVRTTEDLPPTDTLLEALDGVVLGEFPVVIDTTHGSVIDVGTPASR